MPIKNGNVKQSKFATVAVGDTAKIYFTLPAGAMIISTKLTGTVFDAGTLTLYARPINSATPVAFSSFAADGATIATTGLWGTFTGTVPFTRQSVPVAISGTLATAASGGTATVEVEYV